MLILQCNCNYAHRKLALRNFINPLRTEKPNVCCGQLRQSEWHNNKGPAQSVRQKRERPAAAGSWQPQVLQAGLSWQLSFHSASLYCLPPSTVWFFHSYPMQHLTRNLMDLTSHREKVFSSRKTTKPSFQFFIHKQCPWTLLDSPQSPVSKELPGDGRKWIPFLHSPFYTSVLFLYYLNYLDGFPSDCNRQKVQDVDSRDVVMATERETGWLETWSQVIKEAQKPGTRVWYCPVTLRQNSNEDETFCPMLVINVSNCTLRYGNSVLHSTEEKYCL